MNPLNTQDNASVNTPSHQLQDQLSLEFHIEAVRLLLENPDLAQKAIDVLDHWESVADVRSKPLRDQWRNIIREKLWDSAIADTELGRQLRQASPLGFIIPPAQRADIRSRFRSKGRR